MLAQLPEFGHSMDEHPLLEVFLTQPHAAPTEPRIVLIVEDEDIVRRMLTRVLGDAGYRTLEARDGEEALLTSSTAAPPRPARPFCRSRLPPPNF